VKYNPDKHHRKSIRLKGYDYASPGAYFITLCTHQRQCLFGAVVDGEMQLNAVGQMANACWQRLPSSFPHLVLDALIVMPNHVHGILILTNPYNHAAQPQDRLEQLFKISNPYQPSESTATANQPPSKSGSAIIMNTLSATKHHCNICGNTFRTIPCRGRKTNCIRTCRPNGRTIAHIG
jgi:hypothetical protein